MAPASNPQLVVAVNVQNPKRGSYFGNAVAGPVFYHVMKFALQTMKIPPDRGQASQRPAHRTVISGSLGPCLRICVQPASRAGRWPNSPNCSA